MKTQSTVELMWESRLVLRPMAAGGDEIQMTWGELKVALREGAVRRPDLAVDVDELERELIAGRKAVMKDVDHKVYTVFWPEAGIPAGKECDCGFPIVGRLTVTLGDEHTETLPTVKNGGAL